MYDPDHPARSIPALADTVARIDDARNPHNSPAVATRIALDAAQRGYQAGRDQAVMELMTAEDAAAVLGISKRGVLWHAQHNNIGWNVGRAAYVFRPEDIERMRELGRPRRQV